MMQGYNRSMNPLTQQMSFTAAALLVSLSTRPAFLSFRTCPAPHPFLFTHVAHVSTFTGMIVTSASSVAVESGDRTSTLFVKVPALVPLAVRVRVLGKGAVRLQRRS
jgi:hypothetical protein